MVDRSSGSNFYLGCAVWAFKNWVGDFYPDGSRSADFLKLYAERLTAVEGNTTFYSVPSESMVQRWCAETPEHFRFCLKLPRSVTHQGLLMPKFDEAIAFLHRVRPLGDRLGPFFIQLPPGYRPEFADDLNAFLTAWPRQTFPIAVEVRHMSWFEPDNLTALDAMLEPLNVGRVLLDTRPIYECPDDPQVLSERKKPRVPLIPTTPTPFTIVRYISHPNQDQNHRYWSEWVDRLSQWLQAGITVYFFVHCPIEERSPAFAQQVQQQLQAAGADVPPLPWDTTITTTPSQLSLFSF
jgi:uncharacterized protein YecE (DUF72 family)